MSTPDLIILMAISVAAFGGLPILLMWITGRFIGPQVAIIIGLMAAIYLINEITNGVRSCRSVFTPPEPGKGGEGAYAFQCDLIYGAISRNFVWYSGPISILLIVAATYFYYEQLHKQK